MTKHKVRLDDNVLNNTPMNNYFHTILKNVSKRKHVTDLYHHKDDYKGVRPQWSALLGSLNNNVMVPFETTEVAAAPTAPSNAMELDDDDNNNNNENDNEMQNKAQSPMSIDENQENEEIQ